MATRTFSRSKIRFFTSLLARGLPVTESALSALSAESGLRFVEPALYKPVSGFRLIQDGRPRGPLWRGKKLIGKEAVFVVLGLKRFKKDEEKFGKFFKTHVSRLLKMDLIAVLSELQRQEEFDLAFKIFRHIQKEDWYKPDVYMYKDLIVALARCKKMDDAMVLWKDMKREAILPDSQTYAELIKGFLVQGSPEDAMNIYEDMKDSPDPPGELPFKVLLKGLLPYPHLRNKVKQEYEEIYPERNVYDPPEELLSVC